MNSFLSIATTLIQILFRQASESLQRLLTAIFHTNEITTLSLPCLKFSQYPLDKVLILYPGKGETPKSGPCPEFLPFLTPPTCLPHTAPLNSLGGGPQTTLSHLFDVAHVAPSAWDSPTTTCTPIGIYVSS